MANKGGKGKQNAPKKRSDMKMIIGLVVIVVALIVMFTYMAMGHDNQAASSVQDQATATATHPDIDNIKCESMEGTAEHIHPVLRVMNDGQLVPIPQGVGIPADGSCYYWLHTHDNSGTLHVESPVQRDFTLGEFFDVWGQPLTNQQVGPFKSDGQDIRIYVDDKPYTGDPRGIVLKDKESIVLEIGPKFVTPQKAEKSQPKS